MMIAAAVMADRSVSIAVMTVLLLITTRGVVQGGSSGENGTGVQCSVNTTGLTIVIPPGRPPRDQRKVHSTVIEEVIANITQKMKDQQLAVLFSNCYPNTLDTTAVEVSWNDSFVITGDIRAMWLRDSTNQVLPYLPYVARDPVLAELFTGLSRRELRNIIASTYADAYNYDYNGKREDPWDFRKPPYTDLIFEGKYELDQLAAAVKITYHTWKALNGTEYDLFHRTPADDSVNSNGGSSGAETPTESLWTEALDAILSTMANQTLSTDEQNGTYPYEFLRDRWPWHHPPAPTVYPHFPVAWTGMVRSAFRPSDDETKYDFLVPSNIMSLVELRHAIELTQFLSSGSNPLINNRTAHSLVSRCRNLMASIETGLSLAGFQDQNYHPVGPPDGTKSEGISRSVQEGQRQEGGEGEDNKDMAFSPLAVFTYESDGRGLLNNMDDPNWPSLLSLPVIGYESPYYNATRAWVLSPQNPWFFNGTFGCGVGSPHTGPERVWPMSVMTRGLTAKADQEVLDVLSILKVSANNTGFMHESFLVSNVSNYTRSWFAWANSMFGQLILHIADTRPHLIFADGRNQQYP